jgi:predicted dinucleotide-binding enzyme
MTFPVHFTGVTFRDFYETVGLADIVVLAIPAYALEGFIKEYSTLLQGSGGSNQLLEN